MEETTSRFQSRLVSSIKGNRRTKNPLALLNKMENLTRRRFLQYNGTVTFIGIPEDFPLLCSQLFLTAGLLGVDLGLAVRKKFPDLCPYCCNTSCQCKSIKPRPSYKRQNGHIPRESSLADLQKMIVKIYPPERYDLNHQVKKLLEEISECQEAIRNSPLIEVQEELADIFARLAPLAHFLGKPLSLAEAP